MVSNSSLTSGIIGHIYGLKFMVHYMALYFSHQLGSFVGVWLGGLFYDIYGSYDIVWWVGIGVGAFSAISIYQLEKNHYLIQIYKQHNFMDEKIIRKQL